MLETWAYILGTLEQNKKVLENLSKFFTDSFSFNEKSWEAIAPLPLQAYDRDRGRTHMGGSTQVWEGNFPLPHTGYGPCTYTVLIRVK